MSSYQGRSIHIQMAATIEKQKAQHLPQKTGLCMFRFYMESIIHSVRLSQLNDNKQKGKEC